MLLLIATAVASLVVTLATIIFQLLMVGSNTVTVAAGGSRHRRIVRWFAARYQGRDRVMVGMLAVSLLSQTVNTGVQAAQGLARERQADTARRETEQTHGELTESRQELAGVQSLLQKTQADLTTAQGNLTLVISQLKQVTELLASAEKRSDTNHAKAVAATEQGNHETLLSQAKSTPSYIRVKHLMTVLDAVLDHIRSNPTPAAPRSVFGLAAADVDRLRKLPPNLRDAIAETARQVLELVRKAETSDRVLLKRLLELFERVEAEGIRDTEFGHLYYGAPDAARAQAQAVRTASTLLVHLAAELEDAPAASDQPRPDPGERKLVTLIFIHLKHFEVKARWCDRNLPRASGR